MIDLDSFGNCYIISVFSCSIEYRSYFWMEYFRLTLALTEEHLQLNWYIYSKLPAINWLYG